MLGSDAFSRMGYTPSAWGTRYHMLDHQEALGAGSAGPGKTEVLIHEPVFQIICEHVRCQEGDLKKAGKPSQNEYLSQHPLAWGRSTGRALYLRRASTMLTQIIDRARSKFIALDPDVKWSEKKQEFTFSSGYKYKFGHCKDTTDYLQYYSDEFTFILYDEGTQFEEIQYQQINNRLRSTDPVLMGMLKIRVMSNPVPSKESMAGLRLTNPHWVRDYFVDPCPTGNTTITKRIAMDSGDDEFHRRIYLPARLTDNPDPVFSRQYEAKLKANNPPHLIKALLRGDWYAAAGNFFECWDHDLHVIKPFKIPDDWPRFRAMDWGYKTNGTVGWFAMDEDDNLIMEREYTFKLKKDAQVAERIKEIEESLGLWEGRRSLISGPADTQLWEEKGEGAKSKAQTMASMGVGWVGANKKSRAANAEKVTARLMDHYNGAARPGLVVFDTCVMTIKTLPGIQTDPNDIECPQKGGSDHWYDMVSYAVAYASQGPKGISKRRRQEHGESRTKKRATRNRLGY